MLDNLMRVFANPKSVTTAVVLGVLGVGSARSQGPPVAAPSNPTVNPSAGWPRGDWYPPQARRKNIEGEVLVSFTLDATGAPQDVVALSIDHPKVLEAAALGFVKELRFRLPTAWAEGSSTRYKFKVQFDICPFREPPQGPVDVEAVIIRACRVR